MHKLYIYIAFFLSLIFSQLSIYYVNIREEKIHKENIQLNDPFIDNLPYIDGLYNLYDYSLIPIFLLIVYYFKDLNVNNLIINISFLYILRGICILSTSIPKLNSCKIKSNEKKILISGGCYDKIFSGHMALLLTMILYLITYTNQYNYLILYIIYIIFVTLITLLSEAHYSIDIILSFIISICLFYSINNNF